MALSPREHFHRNASLQGHEYIPQDVCISGRYWAEAREDIEAVCLRHPVLFPWLQKGKTNFDGFGRPADQRTVVDGWGCRWVYELDGLDGIVTGHPLADWAAFDAWRPPQPGGFPEDERRNLADRRAAGNVAACGTEHGFLFMRLFYLRGFENLMADMAAEDPRLDPLIQSVIGYWERVLLPRIEAGVDVLNAADDLGTETASIMGPRHFRRWLLPAYQRVFLPARRAGAHVRMHHDGYMLDIVDELLEAGVSIINPQDLVNGIDNIARAARGRTCIQVDVDRQKILPFGSPKDVHDLIREEVLKLGSPAGGLEMVVGIYPPTPVANVEALCAAFEEYRTYWVGRS